jgi:hypothetical protein
VVSAKRLLGGLWASVAGRASFGVLQDISKPEVMMAACGSCRDSDSESDRVEALPGTTSGRCRLALRSVTRPSIFSSS